MKKCLAIFMTISLMTCIFTACSKGSAKPNATTAGTTAQATTQTSEAGEDAVVEKLGQISNDVTDLWNNVFVEARDYAANGTSSTGEPLDIDFVMSTMDKYYNKVKEDKAYMDGLDEKYSDIKLAFSKLYDKAEIIYKNLKEKTPEANKKLTYADEIDLFQQYHTYFYDAVNELLYKN